LVRSMTAYGRAEHLQGETAFIAEIRSLNNRYRDIILRVPKNFQVFESDLKSLISSRVRRGRLDVSIQMGNSNDEGNYRLELNMPLVNSYVKIFEELAEKFGIDQKVDLHAICQMKDVILVRPEEADVESMKSAALEVLSMALDSLDAMRLKEGGAIEADFLARIELLEHHLGQIDSRSPQVAEAYRERLRGNIQNILQEVPVDEARLLQEVALFAERSDITEEVVRIRSHLAQFREYLSVDEALGRRLDFLIQELHREVNTISAKASDSFVSKRVVEIKAELEKLREQVQNVE
jgi:uncharacterized protein (TIGR00255 family)